MKERSRFAPVTTGPSSLQDLAAGYFFLLALVPLLIGAFGLILGIIEGWPTLNLIIGVTRTAAYAAGYIWVGKQLAQGKKLGGYVALGLTVLSFTGATNVSVLIWCLLNLLVIALIWKNLD